MELTLVPGIAYLLMTKFEILVLKIKYTKGVLKICCTTLSLFRDNSKNGGIGEPP